MVVLSLASAGAAGTSGSGYRYRRRELLLTVLVIADGWTVPLTINRTAGVFRLPVRPLLPIAGAPRGRLRSPREAGPAGRAVRRDGGEAQGGGNHAPFVAELCAATQGTSVLG